jgi:RHS repeat-associated protein
MSLQNVYIDGMPVGMTANTKNATVYVSPNFVVKNHGFTKHYYAGSERVMSKIGIGEFNNHFSPTNQVITAGNKNYIQRQSQLTQGLNDYYLQLQIPPGNPTQPNALCQPEVTGNPLPTVVGDYTIPRGWPQAPYFTPPGGPPGPPAQWGDPITNDNVTAGYGYITNGLEERDLYFYHPDHLGSTSIITDRNGVATQFVAYLPFGESFVDEHTSSWEAPYKFSGKEIDEETGLYYFGARYYDAKTSIWYGIDPLAEKYPNVGGMVYCVGNPIMLVDPDGKTPEEHRAAIAKIRSYIGNSYSTMDCSETVDRAIKTSTNVGSLKTGTGIPKENGKGNWENGVALVVSNSRDIEFNDMVEGNLVTFRSGRSDHKGEDGKYDHIGMIVSVTKDENGNVTFFNVIHSTNSGVIEQTYNTAKGTKSISAFELKDIYAWDTKEFSLPSTSVTPNSNIIQRGQTKNNSIHKIEIIKPRIITDDQIK